MSSLNIKTKWHVRPLKTQISLGIRPVWSVSSLSTQRPLGSLATHWAQSEDWSDWADAQADLSIHWAQMSFCLFCHELAQMIIIFHTSLRNAYCCFVCFFFVVFFFEREFIHFSILQKNKSSVLIETKKIDEILKITVESGISFYYQFSHDFWMSV